MRTLYIILILFLYYFPVAGQVFYDQLPRDFQLYPRDTNNQAQVVVSGTVYGGFFTKISMKTLREGTETKMESLTIAPTATSTPFKFSATIKAEPAEYAVQVFIYRGNSDSTLIEDHGHLVCGDVYIIHGQSNALALAQLEMYYSYGFDDKYLRNAEYIYGSDPTTIAWYPATQPFGSVGGLGLTLQRLILQNYGIPTCVLNGAQGGTAIAPLIARDSANHANPNTFYGRLLYRAQWAGVAKQVKAIIWRQGEEDAGSGIPGYAGKFTTLYNQLREDYGNMRIYVGQINILDNLNPVDSAAALRDFQRRTKYLFKNVETIATVGTPGYDGVHYKQLSYQQFAFEQFRQIARDIYGSKDTLQINSPDVKRAFYNLRKDSIMVDFNDQIIWKNDTTFYDPVTGAVAYRREQKNYFYLDRQPDLLAGGSATGSRVILALKQPSSAKALRYLPAYFSDAVSNFYDGPTLKNARGMRAFSFDNVPIADAIATVTTLAAKPLSEKQIQLNWVASAAGEVQILERSDGIATNFKQITALSGTTATYTDSNLPNIYGPYYYRLRAFSSSSESIYSNVVKTQPLVLGLEPTEPDVQLYPNPLVTDRMLHVTADQITFTDFILHNVLGQVVKSWHGNARNAFTLDVGNLSAGVYIADLQTATGQTVRRKLIVR